jgi:polyhydroxyalkanoate synthase
MKKAADFKAYQAGLKRLMSLTPEAVNDKEQKGASREMVYQEDKLCVYRYKSLKKANKNKPPILIVYALVNRPSVLDLHKKRSFIRNLLAQGLSVYLVDWGYPDEKESNFGLEHYICGYINRCVDAVLVNAKAKKLSLLGVCQGGVFSLCYASLFSNKLHSIVAVVTPVDFQTNNNLLSTWVQHLDIDLMVEVYGNIPGSYLAPAFQALKPFSQTIKKQLDLLLTLADDKKASERLSLYYAMEAWIADTPDQPGEVFREFVSKFYQQNALINNSLVLAGKKVLLSNITVPVLNVYASKDHIVPIDSAKALSTYISSTLYFEHQVSTGHIGIFTSASALKTVPNVIDQWLSL